MKGKILIFSAWLSALACILSLNPAWAEEAAVGKAASVVGDADVVRGASGATLPLGFKDFVYLKDRIKTGVGSHVKILLNDNSILKVGPSSELLIDEMSIGQDEESQSTIELIKGKIRSLIGKRLGAQSSFRIKTSVAVAGVRGTDFEVWARSGNETLVRCFQGKVAVSHSLEEVVGSVLLTPNTYTAVAGNAPPAAPEEIKPGEKIEDKAGEKKAKKDSEKQADEKQGEGNKQQETEKAPGKTEGGEESRATEKEQLKDQGRSEGSPLDNDEKERVLGTPHVETIHVGGPELPPEFTLDPTAPPPQHSPPDKPFPLIPPEQVNDQVKTYEAPPADSVRAPINIEIPTP